MTRFVGTPLRGIEFSSPSDEAISARVVSDAHARIRIDAGGRLTWSSGSATGDVNLYRYDINVLKTDDAFQAAGGLTTITTNGLPSASSPDGTIAVDTTNNVFYFRSGGQWLEVSSGANVVIAATAPVDAESGDLWFNSSTLVLYILNGATWVSVSGSLTLAELDDVSIASLETGHVLKYDGTNWVNDLVDSAYTAHTEVIGDGSTKNIVITHNFGTRDIVVQCRNSASPYESVEVGWEATSLNTVTLKFAVAPASASIRANIYAGIGAQGTNAYSQNVGDGSTSTFVLTHNFNTRDVIVSARNVAAPYEVVEINWQATSVNTVTALFSVPPASNAVRVTVYAGGGVAGVTSIVGTVNEIEVSASTGTVQIGLPSSVALSGTPTAPTATYGTDTTQIATTEFVQDAIGGFASTLDGLSDVVITNPEEFQILEYNGVNWVNAHASSSVYVRNAETTTLTTGTVVYLFGATGDHATVKRADNDSDTTSSKTVGVVAAPIAPNENGPVITQGYVDGINLSVGYTSGDVLWLGENGAFTTTKPTAPEHLVFVGVVVRATNNGIIYVSTQNGYELDELHNVSLPSPSAGQFLKYDGSLWVADTIDLGTDTTGNYVSGVTAGTGVTVTHTPAEGSSPTIAIGQAVGTTDSPSFAGLTINGVNAATETYVNTAVANLVDSAPAALDTLNELAAALNDDANFSTTITNALAAKAPLASPALTGTPTAPTAAADTNTTQVATTAFVQQELSATVLNDLNDVNTAGVANGNFLKYNGTNWVPDSVPTINALDDIGDVTITSPSNGQVLKYNGTAWINDTDAQGTTINALNDIGDVTITSVQYGEVVKWNGTAWVNDLEAGYNNAHAEIIGNGSTTTFVLTHNFGTRDIFVQCRNNASPYENINVRWEATTENTVTLDFSVAPASNSVRVNIYASVGVVGPSAYSQTIGDGTNVDYAITHNMQTRDVVVSARNTASPYEVVDINWEATSTNTITAKFSSPPSSNSIRVSVYAAAGVAGVTSIQGTASEIEVSGSTGGVVVGLPTNVTVAGSMSSATLFVDSIEIDTTSASNGQFLGFNGTKFVPTAIPTINTLDDVGDVSIAGIASGQFLKWNGSAWVNDAIDLGTDTTGNYVSSLVAGTGVTLSNNSGESATPTVSIGQSVGTSDAVTFATVTTSNLTTTGGLSGNLTITPNDISGTGSQTGPYVSIAGSDAVGSGTVTGGPVLIYAGQGSGGTNNIGGNVSIDAGYGSTTSGTIGIGQAYTSAITIGRAGIVTTVDGNLTVSGDLTVNGTTTTLNTTELLVEDNIVTLNSGVTSTPSLNAGIEVERGTSTNVQIRWNETTDKWQFTNDGTTYQDLGSGAGGVTVSDTAPASPAAGDMWYESDTGSLFAYYDSYWVEIGPGAVYDQIIGSIQAKGDLLVGTASQTIGRLAVGSNGTRLTANSATSTGVAWVSDGTNTVIDAKGDLLVGTAADTVSRLAVGTDGQILVADSGQSSGVGWVSQNTRNLLYNGAMQIAQRGLSASNITTSGYRTADRWELAVENVGTWINSIEVDAPTGSGFRNSFKVLLSANAEPTVGASDQVYVTQKLEGQDVQAIKKGTANAEQLTLSFWVKSNVTGTYIAGFFDQDNNRHVSKNYVINVSGVWEYKTITFPADTTGAFDNDNALSLYTLFYLAEGSSYQSGSLATAWATYSAGSRAVGQVNLASATNNYWQITGVQLNVGPVAAPFQFNSYNDDLLACKRYYWRCVDPAGVGVTDAGGRATRTLIPFHTEMRSAPTSVVSGTLNFWNGSSVSTATSLLGAYNSKNHGQLDFTGGVGSVNGVVTLYTTGGSQYIEFISEL